MRNSTEKLHSCIPYTMQPCNSDVEKCTASCNLNATTSLQTLAAKVLQRNQQRNFGATNSENQCNRNEIKNVFDATYDGLQEFLGEQWLEYKDDAKALQAWAETLHNCRLIEQGITPPRFTATTTCRHCGRVPCPPELVNNGQVLGCMWCFSRVRDYQWLESNKSLQF